MNQYKILLLDSTHIGSRAEVTMRTNGLSFLPNDSLHSSITLNRASSSLQEDFIEVLMFYNCFRLCGISPTALTFTIPPFCSDTVRTVDCYHASKQFSCTMKKKKLTK